MPRDRSWRDAAALVDIYDAAELISARIQGFDLETFLDDVERQDLIVLRILVIGEAAKRVSAEFRRAHPEIDWPRMAGMRDRLIHGYDQWDLHRVYEVATIEVPELLRSLGPLLPPKT